MPAQVTEDHIAAFVREMNDDEERILDKVLVRQVSPEHYAVQCWYEGEKEVEAFGIYLTE